MLVCDIFFGCHSRPSLIFRGLVNCAITSLQGRGNGENITDKAAFPLFWGGGNWGGWVGKIAKNKRSACFFPLRRSDAKRTQGGNGRGDTNNQGIREWTERAL